MLATEMTLAERAVAYDALGAVFAIFECALDLLWRHAASQRKRHVDDGRRGDVQRRECGFWSRWGGSDGKGIGCEVLSCMH